MLKQKAEKIALKTLNSHLWMDGQIDSENVEGFAREPWARYPKAEVKRK
jgi:hypothetical protein